MNDKQMLLDILMFELPDPNPWEGEIRLLIDRLVANGVTVQKWIGVEERLPEPYRRVLVYRHNFLEDSFYMSIDHVMLTPCEGDLWAGNLTTWKSVVTHWMPLPEQPETGGKAE